jgi:hypothetical protein
VRRALQGYGGRRGDCVGEREHAPARGPRREPLHVRELPPGRPRERALEGFQAFARVGHAAQLGDDDRPQVRIQHRPRVPVGTRERRAVGGRIVRHPLRHERAQPLEPRGAEWQAAGMVMHGVCKRSDGVIRRHGTVRAGDACASRRAHASRGAPTATSVAPLVVRHTHEMFQRCDSSHPMPMPSPASRRGRDTATFV